MPAKSNPIRRHSIRVRAIPVLLLLLTILLTVRAVAEDMPGREVWLPESEVKDRFFGYMIGLIQVDTCGVLDTEDLASVLDGFKGKTSIPFERIRDIRRDCGGGDGRPVDTKARAVSISFYEDLKTPVPYHILGYHPGSVQAIKCRHPQL